MAIVHIVLFEFKPNIEPEKIQDACRRMLALKDLCLHPTTKKPYLKSSIGGRDNSTEGLQNGASHAFIVEFENEDDREHYHKDPAHLDFVKSMADLVGRLTVVDFVPGEF